MTDEELDDDGEADDLAKQLTYLKMDRYIVIFYGMPGCKHVAMYDTTLESDRETMKLNGQVNIIGFQQVLISTDDYEKANILYEEYKLRYNK